MSARVPNDCFALPPGVVWTPVDDALALLAERLAPVTDVETLPLAAAAGRVLAEDVLARRNHPASDNSAVDGYAFAHPGALAASGPEAPTLDDWPTATLKLRDGRAAPGAPWSGRLAPGEAVKVLTGAAMPAGADTVVLQEDVERRAPGAGAAEIRFPLPRKPGANRRRAGENLREGAPALPAGAPLTPQALAQAAAAGLDLLPVRRKLRVALISTGDELIAPSEAATAPPDRVVDSNRPMLAALVAALGAEVVDLGRIPDDRVAVEAALDRAAAAADVALTSGGASGGDEDHVSRALIDAAGAGAGGYCLWRIAMKPGRPLALGVRLGTPVFGLPGNPVAAFVCFLVFVRPALLRLAGRAWTTPRPILAPAGFAYAKKPGRREYLRVRLGPDGRLEKYRSEGSGLIEGLVWSDGLADLAHDAGPIEPGAPLAYLPYGAFGLTP